MPRAALLLAPLLVLPLLAVALPAPAATLFEPPPEGRVADTLVVGFHAGLPGDLDAWASGLGARVELRDEVLAWASLRFPDGAAAAGAFPIIERRGDVRYVEHDVWMQAALLPDDPMWGSQWAPPAIELPEAWDLTLGSHAVKLAILDTGLSTGHADLAGNMCGPFASFIPNEPGIVDENGHGTHVAGIAAAVTNNGVGIAGASQSCIMGAKVLGRSGFREGTSIAAGIRWAADNGAHIISMSLGRPDFLQATADAVKYAWERDVLLIAAAGNLACTSPAMALPLALPPNPVNPLAQNQGSVFYPAFHDEVMAVASLSNPGLVASGFSNCGPDMEVSAPGDGILSTLPGGYGSLSGTSMAAPLVAGVAALVKAQHPDLSALELRCILDLTADDIILPSAPVTSHAGRDARTGWGRVDARAALDLDADLTADGLHGAFAQACEAAEAAIMQ